MIRSRIPCGCFLKNRPVLLSIMSLCLAGQCLGIQGISQLMSNMQNRLMAHGWVTARVLAPDP
ncbi:POTRA domain-containing protein [Photorhabdus khanii]|uniref:Polypeptide-transport-associated ShlB-type domain-containing protein n=1 Tax=Photorhabdus khanii subsp. guanajuatensis TaxID=2100166 RepID=A0A4R4JJT7_9GAMM|nr:POTRA domain-containing protein [Photorhabdus khanii]TDB53681.1 hypothetical protein C5467_14660 [Photorhabdus khanii subsp. guanajuatensis]